MDVLDVAILIRSGIMVFCVGGLAILLPWTIIVWLHQCGIYPIVRVLGAYRRMTPIGRLIILVFTSIMIVHGSTKQTPRHAPSRVGAVVDAVVDSFDNGFDVTMSFTNNVPLSIEAVGSSNLVDAVWRYLGSWELAEDATNVTVRLPLLGSSGFYDVRPFMDTDDDGISDLMEDRIIGTSSVIADADGDGLLDGDEITAGSDPFDEDTDHDGMNDATEYFCHLTDPTREDSDSDGLPDAWEIVNGLDPLSSEDVDGADGDPDGDGMTNLQEYQMGSNPAVSDATTRASAVDVPFVSEGAQWVELTGDLAAEVVKSYQEVVTIPKGTKAFVGVFLHSYEYPTYTGTASQWNDVVSWDITAPGNTEISNVVRVNDEDGSWSLAETLGHYIDYYEPVVLRGGGIMSATQDTDLSITIRLGVKNVSDGAYWTTAIVGVFPLEIVQENWPIGTGFNGMTDNGTRINKRLQENGDGFITGEPEMAQITARFADLPVWLNTTWTLRLVSSRSERPSSDNRNIAGETKWGDDEYDVREMLNTIIGGEVTLNYSIDDTYAGTSHFSIKGKNPTDANVRTYIDSVVPAATRNYAWKIAKHESRQGTRWYNQFNTGASAGLPNKGRSASNHGWGIGQITNYNGTDLVPVDQVWNWKSNVVAIASKLTSSSQNTARFIGYYRTAYSMRANWQEPAGRTILGEAVSAEMWSTVTLYNGAGGIPSQTVGAHTVRSPVQFLPRTGQWLYHKNPTNPEYVSHVVGAGQATGSTE